jgi:hypothetical protein
MQAAPTLADAEAVIAKLKIELTEKTEDPEMYFIKYFLRRRHSQIPELKKWSLTGQKQKVTKSVRQNDTRTSYP